MKNTKQEIREMVKKNIDELDLLFREEKITKFSKIKQHEVWILEAKIKDILICLQKLGEKK